MRRILAIAAVLALVAGCAEGGRPMPAPSPSVSPSDPPHPQSLPALFDEDIDGGDLARGRSLGDFGEFSSWEVTFRSGKLTISGVLNVPDGEGPFPAVVIINV